MLIMAILTIKAFPSDQLSNLLISIYNIFIVVLVHNGHTEYSVYIITVHCAIYLTV